MNKSKSVGIYTLGCRVNQYESCVIAERLSEKGCIIKKNGTADYYIVNTCAVTAESERKSRQLVRRCAAKGKTLVIGCASQLENVYSDIDNVIYVGGNREKTKVVDTIINNKVIPPHIVSMENAPYEEMCLSGKEELFSECRAFVKIQDGCNGKCSYCIIPKCRGTIRSRTAESVLDEIKGLVKCGYHEVILTGIEVGAYNKIPLYELIRQVSEIDGVRRLRLGSLSPKVVNRRFLETVCKLDAFMPHIHLSLQSCCDSVLKAMIRPYRKKDIFEGVEAIREYIPNCMISADIIVGFPGETEEDFMETVNALKDLKIFHVHSFPYSEREGTVAATLPNSVPKSVRAQRNLKLITACNDIKNTILNEMQGRCLSVLVEKITGGNAVGHTQEFLEASFPAKDTKIGDFVEIDVIGHESGVLLGRIAATED